MDLIKSLIGCHRNTDDPDQVTTVYLIPEIEFESNRKKATLDDLKDTIRQHKSFSPVDDLIDSPSLPRSVYSNQSHASDFSRSTTRQFLLFGYVLQHIQPYGFFPLSKETTTTTTTSTVGRITTISTTKVIVEPEDPECPICGDLISPIREDFVEVLKNQTIFTDSARPFFATSNITPGVIIEPCSHVVCLDCYKDYVQNAIQDGSEQGLQHIYCPCSPGSATAPTTHQFELESLPIATTTTTTTTTTSTTRIATNQCSTRLTDFYIRPFVSPEQYHAFTRQQQSQCLSSVENLTHCPNQRCDYQYDKETLHLIPILKCPLCHTHMCSICERVTSPSGSHDCKSKPVPKEEQLKLDYNYQTCPHCQARVVRDAGCNHMTCRCGHQFCYQCQQLWTGHDPERCQERQRSGVFLNLGEIPRK